ncbi:MAG: phosphatase [Bacteroidaceae bacterium]|nr:phosphatase [Bacteroidaceae bacterium]
MNIKLDVHTHTIMSGHAYSTLQEMARAAADKGLDILGITEHGPGIPGACDPIYFRNLKIVPRQMYGVRLLLGAELNILDTEGDIDLDEHHYRYMDIRIAGIHLLCWRGGTREENTHGMVKAIRNPWVQIISHPCDGAADLDFLSIVQAAKECGTLLEINNSSLNPKRKRTDALANTLTLLRLCKQYEVPVILGSDAHISFGIADYAEVLPLLGQTEFPEALVVNDKPQQFLEYLKKPPL